MHRGYVKLWRCIRDNDLWLDEPFTRGQAWIDLLMLANYRPGFIHRRGVKVEVRRGEIAHSYRDLSDRWKWSIGKVQRYFLELKKEAQIDTRIDTEKCSVSTLICIVNYEKYQCDDTENDTETDTKTIRRQVQTKKVKKNKNISSSFDDGFDAFWNLYPRKVGKVAASKAWAKHHPPIEKVVNTLSWQIECNEWLKDSGKFIPHPARREVILFSTKTEWRLYVCERTEEDRRQGEGGKEHCNDGLESDDSESTTRSRRGRLFFEAGRRKPRSVHVDGRKVVAERDQRDG